jgi:hypothetical protein
MRVPLPLEVLALVVAAIVLQRTEFFRTIFEARTSSGSGTRIHFEFYELVRPVLADHPLFGLGLNTFSVYYEFVTGRTSS